ncbi:NAD(P)-binding domain-containing protein [Myxococcota bacterium]|nr:NAD(P)-binding domain-containing protein [Myxococcota bacterium]
MSKIAVLGAGLLGAGFVESLLSKGHQVVVWNRTAAKLAPLVEKGAVAATSPAEAVTGVERTHLVLAEDSVVDAVLEAARPGLAAGAWILDHSTNAPAGVAARHSRLRAAGLRYVHAPVFMSPRDARGATGLMLLAATADEAAELLPLLSPLTGKVWHVGERPDLAAVYKLCGNGMLVSLAGTMGDLFAVAEAQGVPPAGVLALFEEFRAGAALPFMGRRVLSAPTATPSFELAMARKDVRLMIEAAGGPQGLVVLPGVAAGMDAALAQGQGDRDFAVFAWPGRKG